MMKFILISLLLLFNCFTAISQAETLLKPERLQPGDTVALVAPSNQLGADDIRFAVERMRALGLRVILGKYVTAKYGNFAGTTEQRVEDIHAAFKNPKVKAIITLRGGSGALNLLSHLDYSLIRNNPKIFVGFSDSTSLVLALYSQTGLITFYGPGATKPWTRFTTEYFKKIVFAADKPTLLPLEADDDDLIQTSNRSITITSGIATGRILGGNLSVLTALLGSKYFPQNWHGKILFIEDVNEDIYKVDRMLAQLENAGVLKQISGFIFGTCNNCKSESFNGFRLEEVLNRYIKPLNIPAFYGAMIGHQDDIFTIPEGVLIKMDADKGTISLLETAVN